MGTVAVPVVWGTCRREVLEHVLRAFVFDNVCVALFDLSETE
jgi:hypothetical protein